LEDGSKTSATLDVFYGCREVRRTRINSDNKQRVCHRLDGRTDRAAAVLDASVIVIIIVVVSRRYREDNKYSIVVFSYSVPVV